MKIKHIVSTILIAIITSTLSIYFYHQFIASKNIQESNTLTETSFGKVVNHVIATENIDFTIAAKKAVHAVVHIKTTYTNEQNNKNYGFYFRGNPAMPHQGSGSGVIISSDGFIVTNNHVIEQSSKIEIILNDKRSFIAKVIGFDPNTDLALLKIDAEKLVSIPFGDSDIIKVGEWVLAVGNPFNLTSTVTAGIISAKARNINLSRHSQYAIESFIQTDAAVNPGNSGGALVNTKGELIGINTAIATKTGSYSGYSFAIPVSIVKKVVTDLKEYGVVQRALLGITINDVNDDIAKRFNLDKIEGVFVGGILEDGAAKKSGIKRGDVILKINNKFVNKTSELQEQVSMFRPGDKIIVTLKRDNKINEIELILQNQRGTTNTIAVQVESLLGARFEEVSNNEKERYKIKGGIKITELYPGKLKKKGVRKDFIILSINRLPILNISDIENAIKKANGAVYLKGIYPSGIVEYYAFGLEE